MYLRGRWITVVLAVCLSLYPSVLPADPPKPGETPPIRSEDSMLPPESTLQWLVRLARDAGFQFTFIPEIHKLVDKEYSKRVLDAHLWAYWGYHQMPENRHYRMRTWRPVNPNGITRDMVVGMTPEQFSTWIRFAMEIEEPIVGYSYQSGMGFRLLLPGLGRFMGRDPESRQYAESQGMQWCDSAWCEEEKRHAPAFKTIIEKLMGRRVQSTNPSEVEAPRDTLEYALEHVDGRQSTEWNASSTYAALLIHCKGVLHDFFKNQFRDEVKHLAVLSGVDRYLRGPQSWRRLRAIFDRMLEQVRYHTGHRSSGGSSFQSPVFLFELLYTHALVEIKMQQWLDSLPYTTLKKIFETSSKLPDFARAQVEASVLAEMEAQKAQSAQDRLALRWWPRKDRTEREALNAFLAQHELTLRLYVRDTLSGFSGCEDPTSAVSERMRRRILGLPTSAFGGVFSYEQMPMVRAVLYEFLRGYQIENNFETLTFAGRLAPDPDWHNLKLFPGHSGDAGADRCPGKLAAGQ